MTSEDPHSEEPEFPWPQEGDQLFKADEDWELSADIRPWNKDFPTYAAGYKQAADIIVQKVTAADVENCETRNRVVFPVIFLYRHYIELRLKEIILVGNKLHVFSQSLPKHQGSQGLPKHHQLQELWKQARPILDRILDHISFREDLDTVQSCLSEFAQMDPNSESFRYPITREGKLSIENDHLVISLCHLREVMNRLGSFLDKSSDYLHILYQQQSEFEDY